eukprot:3130391-Pyramimonas_sp.AAC.1
MAELLHGLYERHDWSAADIVELLQRSLSRKSIYLGRGSLAMCAELSALVESSWAPDDVAELLSGLQQG